jgi:Macrocin-O-methyltransferase (TylF)
MHSKIITLPASIQTNKTWSDPYAAENHFYQYCSPQRVSKFLAHAKLYEMSLGLPGHFAEAGVFRGASFCRFRKLGRLFHPDHTRRFIGFDIFGKFPPAEYDPDKKALGAQWASDGDTGIARESLLDRLRIHGLAENVELLKGDIVKTLPRYLKDREEISFAIVNIDLDLYKPTAAALQHLFPRVVRGGIVILDDYEGFPGAKKAIDEYLTRHKRKERILKFPFAQSPCYLIKAF